MKYFDAIKNLFPYSRAFQLFVNNSKRKLIKGLSFLPESIRKEAELVYFDLFPDTTRFIEKWESVFAVIFKMNETEKKRAIIDMLWKIPAGGQSAFFLQKILRCMDENIQVIENNPVTNPLHSNVVRLSICGNRLMCCGNRRAVCNYRVGFGNFIPTVIQNDISSFYSIPNDKNYWEFCFYICKSVERDIEGRILYAVPLSIHTKWRNYIEYLILKIKPVHTTAILFINWQGAYYHSINGYKSMCCGNKKAVCGYHSIQGETK